MCSVFRLYIYIETLPGATNNQQLINLPTAASDAFANISRCQVKQNDV